MLNNLENIHTFVLSLLSVPVLLIIFRIDNWYKTEGADHGGGLTATNRWSVYFVLQLS